MNLNRGAFDLLVAPVSTRRSFFEKLATLEWIPSLIAGAAGVATLSKEAPGYVLPVASGAIGLFLVAQTVKVYSWVSAKLQARQRAKEQKQRLERAVALTVEARQFLMQHLVEGDLTSWLNGAIDNDKKPVQDRDTLELYEAKVYSVRLLAEIVAENLHFVRSLPSLIDAKNVHEVAGMIDSIAKRIPQSVESFLQQARHVHTREYALVKLVKVTNEFIRLYSDFARRAKTEADMPWINPFDPTKTIDVPK